MSEIITATLVENQQFLKDVWDGLASQPKHISSKYFYDKRGDELFQQIMEMPEYYLTDAEYNIFSSQKEKILKLFSPNESSFNLIEFGAGDGYKTKVLLNEFITSGARFDYVPIDISENALNQLENTLTNEISGLDIHCMHGDYFEVLNQLDDASERRIVLFLGSNIGNFTDRQALDFLSQIRCKIKMDDLLMIGIDLKKDPRKILNAYKDATGITKEFNFNLLHRINRELDANFDVNTFEHYPVYNPVSGECISMLLSTVNQKVSIAGRLIKFDQWEPIHTEISRKYSLTQIKILAEKSGFEIVENLFDSNQYFTDSIWKAV